MFKKGSYYKYYTDSLIVLCTLTTRAGNCNLGGFPGVVIESGSERKIGDFISTWDSNIKKWTEVDKNGEILPSIPKCYWKDYSQVLASDLKYPTLKYYDTFEYRGCKYDVYMHDDGDRLSITCRYGNEDYEYMSSNYEHVLANMKVNHWQQPLKIAALIYQDYVDI